MAAGGHQAEPGPAAPGSTGAPSLLSEVVFRRLRGLLYDKSGLRFDTTRKLLLTSRVRRRLQATGIGSAEAYVERLSTDPGELLALLDEVTTHETSFFRHRAQMEVFRRRVLPEVIARQRERGTRRLRMWSAACSSGEEPYTLAMIAREVLGREAARWDIQILGTDLARSVLEIARAGVYGRASLRETPAYYVQKYFEHEGPETLRVKDEARRLVSFRLLNFTDDSAMRKIRGCQVVFCRNALIYFDRAAKRRFVDHFARSLAPGGFLFLGHTESLHGISDCFEPVDPHGAFAYRRLGPDACEKP